MASRLVISTVGLDWDLLRMSTVTAPIGFEGMGDWAQVAAKAKRFDEISPAFEEVAAGREARAREAHASGNEVTARESSWSPPSTTAWRNGRSTRSMNEISH